MSAAELRQAAETLRTLIGQPNDIDDGDEFVIPGPWSISGTRRFEIVSSLDEDYDTVAHTEYEQEARYIATMHPGVGLALADWLEHQSYAPFDSTPSLTLARLINGGAA